MLELRPICFILAPLAVAGLGGCSSVSLPAIPAVPAVQKEDVSRTGTMPVELTSIVPGTPTDIYAQVARGALRCWFGADGPLRPTHVFHAEAEPPAKGGSAEMVLHERDDAQRDKRGARALRVLFSSEAAGVRVTVAIPKMERQLADVMGRDVAGWAKGGEDCELRRHMPPVLTPVVGERTPPRGGR